MPHERENTRTGREKSFHSFISFCVGIVFLIWKPYMFPPAPLFPHLPRIFAPTACGSTPSPIGWEKIRFHEFQHLSSRIRYFCAPKVTRAPPGISYEYV